MDTRDAVKRTGQPPTGKAVPTSSRTKSLRDRATAALADVADLGGVSATVLLEAVRIAFRSGMSVRLADLSVELVRRMNAQVKFGPVVELTVRTFEIDGAGVIKRRPLLVMGSEGGAYTIWEGEQFGRTGFVVEVDDSSGTMLDEEDYIPPVHRWTFAPDIDVLAKLLPEWWPKLYPVFLDPGFWPDLEKLLFAQGYKPSLDSNWGRAMYSSFDI